jgi:putative oxidoreductase
MAVSATAMKAVVLMGRVLLGGVFAYAAINKLIDVRVFAADIDHFRLLPYPLTLVAGIYLPWVELVCAIALLLRWHERGALLLCFSLCLFFFTALASAWLRELDISCGCFGHSQTTTLPMALARSAFLALIALWLFARTPVDQKEPDHEPPLSR